MQRKLEAPCLMLIRPPISRVWGWSAFIYHKAADGEVRLNGFAHHSHAERLISGVVDLYGRGEVSIHIVEERMSSRLNTNPLHVIELLPWVAAN